MTDPTNWASRSWSRGLIVGVIVAVVLGVVVIIGVLVIGREPGARDGGATTGDASCQDPPTPDPLPLPSEDSEAVVAYAVGASYWNPTALGQNLSMAAYADGTVILASGIGGYPGGEPALSRGWVGPCAVAEAAARLTAVATADFGLPSVADAATALVMVHPFDEQRQALLEVYALEQADIWPENDDALSDRRTVQDVLRSLESISDPEPWRSDRFRAQWSDGFTRMVGPQVTSWPLTTSITDLLGPNGCADIPRSSVDALVQAQPDRELVAQWTDGVRATVVALSVLMPGEPACPPRPTPWR